MKNPTLTVGISVGGSIPQGVPSANTLFTAVRQAEAAGYDAIWTGDHIMMYTPILDSVTLLAAFAGITERVKLGTAVYLLPLRHPVATAKLFAGLDFVSGGRLLFGVGVGGEFAKEFEAVGVAVKERGSRTDEGIEIIKRLWTETHVTHEGRHFKFRDVTIAPSPIGPPPIWIGGRSDAALRRTARFADGWLGYMASAGRIQESMEKIQGQAGEFGRRPEDIAGGLLLFLYGGPDTSIARKRVVDDLSTRYNQPFEKIVDSYCAYGTPADCAAQIEKFLDAGVTTLVVKFTCRPDEQLDQQAAFAETVLPLLRARRSG